MTGNVEEGTKELCDGECGGKNEMGDKILRGRR